MKPKPWWTHWPQSIPDKLRILRSRARHLNDQSKEGANLRDLWAEVQAGYSHIQQRAKDQNPLAFFLPSLEQSIILNAWIFGYTFTAVFTANRIGKTAACIINILLWLIPNHPRWRMFHPRLDEEDPRHPMVQILRRPDISSLKLIQQWWDSHPKEKSQANPSLSILDPTNQAILHSMQNDLPSTTLLSNFPLPPWDRSGNIWFCAPDFDTHKQTFMPEWKRWIPPSLLKRFSIEDKSITLSIPAPKNAAEADQPLRFHRNTPNVWVMQGKSFDSKDEKFASGAVDAIAITEGIPPSKFKELKLRFKYPGIGSWDYTPWEPVNQGSRSALARRVFSGEEPVPLRLVVFTKFSIRTAPERILPTDKRDDMIRSFQDTPEGKARLDGEFYSTSGKILEKYDQHINLIKNLSLHSLQSQLPDARLYRFFDPGLDHPSACLWAYLLPSRVWIVYRVWSARNLSISERCQQIARLSGNQLARKRYGRQSSQFYRVEIHPHPHSEVAVQTVADFHVFKRDETTKLPFATNYTINGIPLTKSKTYNSEFRVQKVNELLVPSQDYPHPITGLPPSPRLLFLEQGPGVLQALQKWDGLYWQTYLAGEHKGQPKDRTPTLDDDELDTLGYLATSDFSWTKTPPRARIMDSQTLLGDLLVNDVPDKHLVRLTEEIRGSTIPNHVVFGEEPPDPEYEDNDSDIATIAKRRRGR